MYIISRIRSHAVIATVVGLLIIIIAVIGGRAAKKQAPATVNSGVKQVAVLSAATFRKGDLAVAANGKVESFAQADLKTQTSAPVAVLHVAIGQTVSAGTILLELQNSDIRAQLAQAQAGLAVAQGQYKTGAVSLESAQQAAVEKIHDAYAKTNDAIVAQTEPILINIDGNGGKLASFSHNTTLTNEINAIDIDFKNGDFRTWKAAIDALSSTSSTDDIEATIKLSQKNMIAASTLLSDISQILNEVSSSGYSSSGFTTSVATSKATISGARSAITGAIQALTSAELGLNTSGTSQDSTAQAQIAAAQAGVNNFAAQLAKTIIRSPIAGKVSALPLREGELASPGTLVATVIGNKSGLKITAYMSGGDLPNVQVGAPVTIKNQGSQQGSSTIDTTKGTVSNIAPSVDPVTKQAEVDVTVTDPDHSGLVIGQTVSVLIGSMSTTSLPTTKQDVGYLLPIQDVKIIPGAAYVYTVDEHSKIKRNDVTVGAIQGDFIKVTGGLNDSMNIVTPVYELDEGMTVQVAQ